MHQCYRFWCFERNFWCLVFWQQIWCWLSWCFFPIFYPFRMKIVRFITSISHFHVCLVIVSSWRSSPPSIVNNITRYAYNRFLYLMMILRSVSDSTWLSHFARYWCRIVARKSSIGVFHVYVGGLDILKFDKNSTDLKCFIFQFGGLGALFGRQSPPKTPVATGLYW